MKTILIIQYLNKNLKNWNLPKSSTRKLKTILKHDLYNYITSLKYILPYLVIKIFPKQFLTLRNNIKSVQYFIKLNILSTLSEFIMINFIACTMYTFRK